jgi:glucosamine--fructose-6-phosphate aminotransferase (isomerizing)
LVDGYIKLAQARATQADLLERAIPVIASEVMAAARRGALSGPGPIFLGIGASYAASAAAVWTLRTRGIDAYRLNAGEHPIPFPASPHPIIGVSQSGRSSETLAVLGAVEGRLRMAVLNVVPSPIADIATTAISLGNLPDSYASTTGYTATIAALGMIAEAWDNGAIDSTWTALPAAFRQLEATLAARIGALAQLLVAPHSVDYAAAASSVGSAEVGSLLLREVARIPATGFSTRQYLHGAMESAGQTVHILMGDEREIGLGQTLARAGHDTILLTVFDIPDERHLHIVRMPPVSPAQRPILEALVLQSLAVEAALLRGLDPDAFVFFHTDTKVAAQ